jgi:hypothetical protein
VLKRAWVLVLVGPSVPGMSTDDTLISRTSRGTTRCPGEMGASWSMLSVRSLFAMSGHQDHREGRLLATDYFLSFRHRRRGWISNLFLPHDFPLIIESERSGIVFGRLASCERWDTRIRCRSAYSVCNREGSCHLLELVVRALFAPSFGQPYILPFSYGWTSAQDDLDKKKRRIRTDYTPHRIVGLAFIYLFGTVVRKLRRKEKRELQSDDGRISFGRAESS